MVEPHRAEPPGRQQHHLAHRVDRPAQQIPAQQPLPAADQQHGGGRRPARHQPGSSDQHRTEQPAGVGRVPPVLRRTGPLARRAHRIPAYQISSIVTRNPASVVQPEEAPPAARWRRADPASSHPSEAAARWPCTAAPAARPAGRASR